MEKVERSVIESQEFLHQIFDYRPDGYLTWKFDIGTRTKSGDVVGCINQRTKSRMVKIHGNGFTLRRLIWLFHGNRLSENECLVPINGNQVDDRIENLKIKPLVRGNPPDRILERDVALVRELFRYNPKSGKIYWRESRKIIRCDRINFRKVYYQTHRICFIFHHGRPIGNGLVIDHLNGDHRDNTASNLREATPSQNAANAKVSSGKKSGLPKGVSKMGNAYIASIKINGKSTNLGSYKTIDEAADAYRKASLQHHGEFSICHRPPDCQ